MQEGRRRGGVNGWFICSLKCSPFTRHKESSPWWKAASDSRGIWKVKIAVGWRGWKRLRGGRVVGVLMETSRWQGRGSGTYISICGLSVTSLFPLRLFTCVDHLQVTFAARHIFISDWPRLERQKAYPRLHTPQLTAPSSFIFSAIFHLPSSINFAIGLFKKNWHTFLFVAPCGCHNGVSPKLNQMGKLCASIRHASVYIMLYCAIICGLQLLCHKSDWTR